MKLLIHISCCTKTAENDAYNFCLNILESEVEIYRLFFSGPIVTSALNVNSKWMSLCQVNHLEGVCCSHSLTQENKDSLTPALSNSQKNTLNNPKSLNIQPGGLALLVEGAIKSDRIVNFNDNSPPPLTAEQILKHSHSALEEKERANEHAFILSLTVTQNDYHDQRLSRLIDAVSVFLVFDQQCKILLDLNVLQYTGKERIVKDIKTLSEFGLKNLTFFSPPKANLNIEPTTNNTQPQEQLLDTLRCVVTELATTGIECQLLEQQKDNEHLTHRSVSF